MTNRLPKKLNESFMANVAGLLFEGAVGDDAPLVVFAIPKQAQNGSALVFETEEHTVVLSDFRSFLTAEVRLGLLLRHSVEGKIPGVGMPFENYGGIPGQRDIHCFGQVVSISHFLGRVLHDFAKVLAGHAGVQDFRVSIIVDVEARQSLFGEKIHRFVVISTHQPVAKKLLNRIMYFGDLGVYRAIRRSGCRRLGSLRRVQISCSLVRAG